MKVKLKESSCGRAHHKQGESNLGSFQANTTVARWSQTSDFYTRSNAGESPLEDALDHEAPGWSLLGSKLRFSEAKLFLNLEAETRHGHNCYFSPYKPVFPRGQMSKSRLTEAFFLNDTLSHKLKRTKPLLRTVHTVRPLFIRATMCVLTIKQ